MKIHHLKSSNELRPTTSLIKEVFKVKQQLQEMFANEIEFVFTTIKRSFIQKHKNRKSETLIYVSDFYHF